jgi:hypothetical protein
MQPFADVMAKKFGAAVSVLMVLPIGEKNGEIELRRCDNSYQGVIPKADQSSSVHSGTTSHSVPMTWPVFDRSGFAEVQKSMINFGRHVFSMCLHFINDKDLHSNNSQVLSIEAQG